MAGKRTLHPDIEALILSDYIGGMRSSEIALKYDINRKTVTIIVKRNGGKVRTQKQSSGRSKDNMEPFESEIVRLRSTGLSQQKIAKIIGKSQALVSRVLISKGMPTETHHRAEKHGSWKGGRHLTDLGYVYVYLDFQDDLAIMRTSTGYVLEHRLVVARWLGRPLSKHETVHHINGVIDDNRLENLQLRQGLHGKGVIMQCACCGSMDVIATKIAEVN